MKILLVEDDEALLQLMAHHIQKETEAQVITATNGKQGMRMAEQHWPDLIITDILMPIATGIELIAYVREELKLNTYLMVLSTVGIEKNKLEALEAGADEFIAKPFDLQKFLFRIQNLHKVAQAS